MKIVNYHRFRIIRIIVILFFVLSCALFSSCQKSYKYYEYCRREVGRANLSPSELNDLRLLSYKNMQVETKTIQAFSESSANRKAYKLYTERRESAINKAERIVLGENEKKEIDPIPISYELVSEDGIGNKVVIHQTDRNPDFRSWGKSEDKGNSVYAGARFGMTPSEVKRLEQFEDFQWNESEQCYDGADSLGLFYYNIRLYFEKGLLFKVEFTSPEYAYSFVGTEKFSLIDDIRNLRKIFWRVYGRPSYYDSIPSDWNRVKQFYVYKWKTSRKDISVGCRESCSFATIIDQEWIEKKNDRERQIKENQEIEKKNKEAYQEKKIEDAVSKFQ